MIEALTVAAYKAGFRGEILACTCDHYDRLIAQTSPAFMERFTFQFPDFDDPALERAEFFFRRPKTFFDTFNERFPDEWTAVSWEYAAILDRWHDAVEVADSLATPTVLAALKREPVDRTPICNPTSVATVELMDLVDTPFPEANRDPELMARLAATGYTELGFDTIMPVFSIIQESVALGIDIDWMDGPERPTFTVGDTVSVKIGSTTFTHTVTQSDLDAVDPVASVISSLEALIDADTSLGVTAEAVSSTSSPFGIEYVLNHSFTGTYPNMDTNLTAVSGETVELDVQHATVYQFGADHFVQVHNNLSSYHQVSEHQTPEGSVWKFVDGGQVIDSANWDWNAATSSYDNTFVAEAAVYHDDNGQYWAEHPLYNSHTALRAEGLPVYTNDTTDAEYQYDALTNSWSELPPMPALRHGCGGALRMVRRQHAQHCAAL